MIGYKNTSITIGCRLDDASTSSTITAKIFDNNGSLSTSLALSHVSSGLYTNTWTPATNGYYNILYTTPDSNYNKGVEELWVIDSLAVSSQIEAYGGGGGKSYNVYSKVLSPWNKDTVKKVVDGVEKTKETLDKLVKEEIKYHKDDEKRLEKLIKILDNILLTSVEKKDMKGVKESIDNAKKKLEEYKKDKSLDIEKLNKELVAIVKMLSLRMTDEELDKILESDIEEIK